MANRNYRDPEDESEDDLIPDSSISSRPTVGNIAPSPAIPSVKDFLTQKMSTSKVDPNSLEADPLMQQYMKEKSDTDDFRKVKMQADHVSNLGQAFSQLAQGTNAPKENSVFKNIASQNQDLLGSKEKDLDRRRKVMDAIENRKVREASLLSGKEDRKVQRSQIQAGRDLAREDRIEREGLKREEKDLALAVPGYERTGEVLPKPEEAVKLRNATANAEQLGSKLNRLMELVDKYGSFERGGEAGTEMESLATEIQLLSKNKDMYDLGVLTGPDMGLLQKITADPSSMDSLFTRDSTRKKQIGTQLNSVRDKLSTVAKSMGYRRQQDPLNQPTPSQGNQASSRAGQIVKVRGKMYRVGSDGDSLEELM